MSTSDKKVGVSYGVIVNALIPGGQSYRALVSDPVMIKLTQFYNETAAILGVSVDEVQRFNQAMNQVTTSHLQLGHGVDTGFCSFEPTVKGTFTSPDDYMNPPKQHVDFVLHKSKSIEIDLYSIPTTKVQVSKKRPVITSVEDGVTEIIGGRLTPNGTLILSGSYLKFSVTKTDEGVFFIRDGIEIPSTKVFVNTNKEVQVRIPLLATGEHYRVVLRKRFAGKKVLYGEVSEAEFVVAMLEMTE